MTHLFFPQWVHDSQCVGATSTVGIVFALIQSAHVASFQLEDAGYLLGGVGRPRIGQSSTPGTVLSP